MKTALTAWLLALFGAQLHAAQPPKTLEDLRLRAIAYFVDNADAKTGLVSDRAANSTSRGTMPYKKASISATGMGLAVLAHAAKTGRLARPTAYAQIEKTLAACSAMPHYKGWFYHFIDPQTGARADLSEVSTIDTGLFLAGALYAAQVFPGTQAATQALALFDRTDFPNMLTNGGAAPSKTTLSHGWTPEGGYLRWQWDSYAEHTMLLLLGIGHKNPIAPAVWKGFARPTIQGKYAKGALLGLDLPLFVHQYSHLFVDFRGLKDSFGDYFENSKAATQESRSATLLAGTRATYRAGYWGLSAGDSPTGGYEAYSPVKEDGTVCPGCAGASAMFDPPTVLGDLNRWIADPKIASYWGPYGFPDGINLDQQWASPDAIGITVAALYLGLVNIPGEVSIWQDFMQTAAMRKAIPLVFPARSLALSEKK
ncbi:hypothetical protein K2X33_13310 [bacterium]|nr:hypothetical protein [bacterium]